MPSHSPERHVAESRINAEVVLKNYKTYLLRFKEKSPSESWELNLQAQYRKHLSGNTPERYLHSLRESANNADIKKCLIITSLTLELIESIDQSKPTKPYLTPWSVMKLAFDFSKLKGSIGKIFSTYIENLPLEKLCKPFLDAKNSKVSLNTWSALSDKALEHLEGPGQNTAQQVLAKSLDRVLRTGSTKQLPRYLAEHFINNATTFSQQAVEYFAHLLQTNSGERYDMIFQEIIKHSFNILNPAIITAVDRKQQGIVLSMLSASTTFDSAYHTYSEQQQQITAATAHAIETQKQEHERLQKEQEDRIAIENGNKMIALLQRCNIDVIDPNDFKLYFSTFLSNGHYYKALNPRTWETIVDSQENNKFSLTELGEIYSTRVTMLNGVNEAQQLQQQLRQMWQEKEIEWQHTLNEIFNLNANSLIPIITSRFAPQEHEERGDIILKNNELEKLETVCKRTSYLPEPVQTFIQTQLQQQLNSLKQSLQSRLEKFDRDEREHEREQADQEALLDYIEKYAEVAMDYLVALISRGTGINSSELKTNISDGALASLSSVITTGNSLRLTQRVEQALVQRIELLRGSGLFLEIGDSIDIAKTRIHAIPWETPHEIAHEVSKQTNAEKLIRASLTNEVERIAKLFVGKPTAQSEPHHGFTPVASGLDCKLRLPAVLLALILNVLANRFFIHSYG